MDDASLFLTIEQGKQSVDSANYTFYPTIPILCPINFPTCVLSVEMNEPRIIGDVAPSCPNARKVSQLAFALKGTGCLYEIGQITEPSPNTKISITIHANSDMLIPPEPETVVHLLLKTIDTHSFHPIWQQYLLPVAQVKFSFSHFFLFFIIKSILINIQ